MAQFSAGHEFRAELQNFHVSTEFDKITGD